MALSSITLWFHHVLKLIDYISKNLQHNTVVEAYSNIDNM